MSIASKWDEKLRVAAGEGDVWSVPQDDLRALVDDALEWHKLGVKTLVTQSLEAERLDKENSRLKARVLAVTLAAQEVIAADNGPLENIVLERRIDDLQGVLLDIAREDKALKP